MGWSSDQMWEAVEKYRTKFATAEKWRTDLITEGRANGYVQLPDGLIRYRYEATEEWCSIMMEKFYSFGPIIGAFGDIVIKRIRNRAGNQMVNAKVQGTCATLAKRSQLKMAQRIVSEGFRARFQFLVHDELVFSVHKDDVQRFIPVLREVMCSHPDIFKSLVLNCSMAIGKNYWVYDKIQNPKGQIELDEANKGLPFLSEDRYEKKMTGEEIEKTLEYLFS